MQTTNTAGRNAAPPPDQSLPGNLVLLLATAAGLAVAALYYSQPILGELGADMGASAKSMTVIFMLQGLIIGNGVLTVEDEDQAWARARLSEGDKGGGAARACLDLIALRKRLRLGLGA